jgi:hypothetical protein
MRILLLILLFVFSINISAQEDKKQGEFLGARIVDELPNWLKVSFMDFSEDLKEATDEGKAYNDLFSSRWLPLLCQISGR